MKIFQSLKKVWPVLLTLTSLGIVSTTSLVMTKNHQLNNNFTTSLTTTNPTNGSDINWTDWRFKVNQTNYQGFWTTNDCLMANFTDETGLIDKIDHFFTNSVVKYTTDISSQKDLSNAIVNINATSEIMDIGCIYLFSIKFPNISETTLYQYKMVLTKQKSTNNSQSYSMTLYTLNNENPEVYFAFTFDTTSSHLNDNIFIHSFAQNSVDKMDYKIKVLTDIAHFGNCKNNTFYVNLQLGSGFKNTLDQFNFNVTLNETMYHVENVNIDQDKNQLHIIIKQLIDIEPTTTIPMAVSLEDKNNILYTKTVMFDLSPNVINQPYNYTGLYIGIAIILLMVTGVAVYFIIRHNKIKKIKTNN